MADGARLKLRALGMTVLQLALLGCAARPAPRCIRDLPLLYQTKKQDLGHGYAMYNEGYQAAAGSWEGRVHYQCLHYRGTAVALPGDLYVSPSGRYLLYSDGPSGIWFIADEAGASVAKGPVGESLPKKVIWDEPRKEVALVDADGTTQRITFGAGLTPE